MNTELYGDAFYIGHGGWTNFTFLPALGIFNIFTNDKLLGKHDILLLVLNVFIQHYSQAFIRST